MYVFNFFAEKEKPSLNLTISQQYQSSKMSSLKKLLNEKSTSIFLMVCLIFLPFLSSFNQRYTLGLLCDDPPLFQNVHSL